MDDSRMSPEYNKVRLEVKKRDKCKCQFPGCKRRVKLEVHHITPYSQSVAGRLDKNNLITLCRRCHLKVTRFEHIYAETFRTIVSQNENNNKRH